MAETEALPSGTTALALDRFPRITLCHGPTPIEAMPRLGEELGDPSLFVKRDDCTGLATGGNKTRRQEFLVGEALRETADMRVTQGAVQSSHVRQTAAAACKIGMKHHALLERRMPDRDAGYEKTGAVLLDELFGATYEFRPGGLDTNAEAANLARGLPAQGHRPYFIPGGGSNPTGALGYVECAREIVHNMAETGQRFDWLVTATGSTGTQAGLVAGFHALGDALPVMGVSVRRPRDRQMSAVHALTQKTLEKLGAAAFRAAGFSSMTAMWGRVTGFRPRARWRRSASPRGSRVFCSTRSIRPRAWPG